MGSPKLTSVQAELARRSLYKFLRYAWPVIEPGNPLLDNWHLEYLCKHVQSVALRERGAPRNLVINIPPGTMKSLIVSVALPAWVWLRNPAWSSIYASANPRVSARDSMRCRDLLESEWYKTTFNIDWKLADDQNLKTQYKNSRGGTRTAISVGARITGARADALFIDDPHDAAEVTSKVERESVLWWYDSAFANRVNSPSESTRVIIMQRLHDGDLTGHVLEHGQYSHLSLPMEFEGDAEPTWLGLKDPRTQPGELLFPARFPTSVLEEEKKRLGSAGYAGQMQQRPAPVSGNRFKREWWRFWSPVGRILPRPQGCNTTPPKLLQPGTTRFTESIQSWDLSFKQTTTSDYVVGLLIGRIGADKYVLDYVRERLGFGDTRKAICAMRARWPKAYSIIIEDKANGPAIIDSLKAELPGVIGVSPEGGKEARAAALEPEVEAGNWYLPEGAPWLGDWVEEFATFPHSKHDDQVDACSQAAIHLKVTGDTAHTRMLLGIRLV